MADKVHKVTVRLAAEHSKFASGFAKASKLTQSFGSTLKKVGKVAAIGTLAIGAAGVAAAGSFAYASKKIIDDMDAMGKASDKLGIATEKLTALRHAASLSGIDFAQLSGGLKYLNKSVSETIQGTGEAKVAFEMLGLSAQALEAMPLEQQLLAVSDALKTLPSHADRTSAAMKIFGKSGADLLPMLLQGKKGISDLMGEADKLGITFDRPTAKMAENINDSISRITQSFKGLGVKLLGPFLPEIERIVTQAVSWVQANLPMIGNIISSVANGILETWKFLYTFWTMVFDAIGNVLESFGVDFSSSGNLIDSVVKGIVSIIKWFATGFITAVTFIEVIFTQFPNTLRIIFLSAGLAIVGFALDIKHWFTVTLPAYIEWFSTHWREVFTDIWNITTTIFTNLWSNITKLWTAIKNYLSGDGWQFDWKPLTEGFKSAMTDLPQIAERQLSDVEKQMTKSLNKAQKEWASEYDTKLTDRLSRLNVGEPEKPKDDKPKPDDKPTLPGDTGEQIKKQIEGQIKIITSSRFSIAGMETAPQVKIANEQLKEQKRTNDILENLEMGGIA